METLSEQQKAQLETVNGINNKLIWAIFKGTPGTLYVYLCSKSYSPLESVEYFIRQGADIEHKDKGAPEKLLKHTNE
jgi:hypothetical protein